MIRARHPVCVLMLLVLAFWQASLVHAACAMDRGELGRALSEESHECCDEVAPSDAMPMSSGVCLAHVTSDLQALGIALSFDAPPAGLILFRLREPQSLRAPTRTALAPPAVPPRILLHSFLI